MVPLVKKSWLKDQLERKQRKVDILKGLAASAQSTIMTLRRELGDAKTAPLPDHIEAVIAGRVEIAVGAERRAATREVKWARARVIQELLNDLKLEMLEPGTQEYWNEFRDWLKGRPQ